MEITDVKIFKAKRRGPVLSYANVILNDCLIIRRITLIEKNGKRYLSMPAIATRDTKDDEKRKYRDICHPLKNEIREKITETVFVAYDEFIANEE